MRRTTDVFYLTLPVDNSDQAVSLAEYLNQHGIAAGSEGVDGVTCPLDDPATAAVVHQLHQTWDRYWEYSDSGLFGLPVLMKDYGPDSGGCPTCGAGPVVK